MDNSGPTHSPCDGICTSDNPVPIWWKRTFLATFFFSICYGSYFLVGAPGRSSLDSYDAAAEIEGKRQLAKVGNLEPTAETLVAFASHSSKKSILRIGQSAFRKNCAACHGRNGEGKIGPNLADDVYKNVRRIEDIPRIIEKGAGSGAMPAWGDKLQKNEIVLLAAYVASLRATSPADGKAAEGVQIAPWPVAAPDVPDAPAVDAKNADG